MAQVQYQETKVVKTTREIPDHFAHDNSKRGRIVDILVGTGRREDLWRDEKNAVEYAIQDLTDAYDKATKILAVFCEVESAA